MNCRVGLFPLLLLQYDLCLRIVSLNFSFVGVWHAADHETSRTSVMLYIDSTFFGAVWSNVCLQLSLHMLSSECFRAGVSKLVCVPFARVPPLVAEPVLAAAPSAVPNCT